MTNFSHMDSHFITAPELHAKSDLQVATKRATSALILMFVVIFLVGIVNGAIDATKEKHLELANQQLFQAIMR